MAKNLQLVVFTIGKEFYGVGIDVVHEIVRVPEITGVPDAPVFLEGVINLRGRIVPVIDLRKRLRLNEVERTKAARVLITDHERKTVGLLVDSVAEVLKLTPEMIEAPPEMVASVGIDYITGVAKVNDRLVILLDLGKVLNAEDMLRIVEEAEPETADAPAAA